jgi:hypothetical protein
MPKSGHMANQHAKVCAAAIIALLADQAPNPTPVVTNTCYSFVTDSAVIHVASVHQYDSAKKTLAPVTGAGGVSPAMTDAEGVTRCRGPRTSGPTCSPDYATGSASFVFLELRRTLSSGPISW